MAKGFTVKADVPKKKESQDTFNIDEAKEIIKGNHKSISSIIGTQFSKKLNNKPM